MYYLSRKTTFRAATYRLVTHAKLDIVQRDKYTILTIADVHVIALL